MSIYPVIEHNYLCYIQTTHLHFKCLLHDSQYMCYKSGSCVNDKRLSLGVYGVYSSIKIALKRYKDILQIQLKYNKMHTVILHSPHTHLFTIHSFIHSFIRSFIHSHHTTHASPMHHPFITHCIILCITHSSHCIPTHHTMHHPFITLHLNPSYQ